MSGALRQPVDPDEPGVPGVPASDGVERRLTLAAQREHALESLMELGHELTVALAVYETADLLLFNLMGQLGASRSALWLVPEEGDEAGSARAVLVRAHGFKRPVVDAIGYACAASLLARFGRDSAPVLTASLPGFMGPMESELMKHAEIALIAPLHARGELLGWLALGHRVDGADYVESNLQVLEASLGMVAVSLQNARLYNRARETNRLLRMSNEHLSELDRLKTDFLNNVNHELRTPLAVVMATLECVVSDDSADARTRDLLQGSLEQSRKLNGLIENLLMFSEVRESRNSLRVVEDDIAAVLDSCIAERLPGVTAGLREMEYKRDADVKRARFDRVRLHQIVNELIDNAVKFTPRGSRIEMRALRCIEDGREWVRVEIKDNGPGIAPERMDSVFRAFEQVDGSMTRAAGGLGMGLAFARELAEHMGGRLTGESALGQGSTFRLRLPAS